MAVVAPRQRRRQTGAQPVDLGRFSGGLNTAGQQETIAESEVWELSNLEVDVDGSLVTRPPIERANSVGLGNLHKILGYATAPTGDTLLVVTFPEVGNTQVLSLVTNTWTQIAGFEASSFVQFDYKIVLARTTGAGGYWDLAVPGFTSTASMPPLVKIVYYLGRFWGAGVGTNSTTLYWSKLTVPGVSSVYDWAVASDYLTVGAGDGQTITGLIVDPSGLLILKQSSTYRFTYASGPAAGTLVALSGTTGADSAFAYVAVDNYYVVFCAGTLYQLLQGKFYPLSRKKIAFVGTDLGLQLVYNVAVSLFGDRVMLWFYGTLYCYNLTTQTWSTWSSLDSYAAYFVTVPTQFTGVGAKLAYATTGVYEATRRRLYRAYDSRYGLTETGGFLWKVTTRAYNFGSPFDFKRLMYWSVSLFTSKTFHAVTYAPVPVVGPVDEYDNAGQVIRRVVRIRAAFRFLQVWFQLSGNFIGTDVSAPTRIYGITAYLRAQDDVAAKETGS